MLSVKRRDKSLETQSQYLLVLTTPLPLLRWDPLLDLTQLVLHSSVKLQQTRPQGARLLRVLQVQRGRHYPQGLEEAGLYILTETFRILRSEQTNEVKNDRRLFLHISCVENLRH